MTTTINANTSAGLVYSADTSGIVKLQSNGVTTNALAWVNFNGASSSPITPRSSYNVSSVTKASTAEFTINFTTAASDANYAVVVGAGDYGGSSANAVITSSNPISTTSCFICTRNGVNANVAYTSVSVAIFGN